MDTIEQIWYVNGNTNAGEVCDPPVINSVSTIDSSSLRVQWNSVPGATSYLVEHRIAGDETEYEVIAQNVTGNSFTDTGLMSNTKYWYRVYAVNGAGISGKSDSVSGRTRDYLSECTYTEASFGIRVTTATDIKTLPCGKSTNAGSEAVHTCSVGETYTVDRIYTNTNGDKWYRVTYNGTTGYIMANKVTSDQTYTISYNANGGINAPDNQTKTHGTALTLSNTVPTRNDSYAGSYRVHFDACGGETDVLYQDAERITGYTFKNWNTAQNGGGTSYNPGASYTANAAITLYAQWNSETHTEAIELPTATREGFTFGGWAETAAAASGGITGSYTPTEEVTLYAVWENASFNVYYFDGAEPGWLIPPTTNLEAGEPWTVPSDIPEKEGFNFEGWHLLDYINESSDAWDGHPQNESDTVDFVPGQTVSPGERTFLEGYVIPECTYSYILTAVWSPASAYVESEDVTFVWDEDGNGTVYDADGNLLRNTWIHMVIPLQGPDGEGFNDVIWRYTDENGKLVEGWREIDGYTYYFLDSITFRNVRDMGYSIDGAYYYFDEDGHMYQSAWVESPSGRVYYADADGKLLQGWQTIEGKQYYFAEIDSGAFPVGILPYRFQNGVFTIDGESYLFAEDGTLIGKVETDQPTFRIGDMVGRAGGTVTIPVSLENNPGIALFKVYVEYDEDVLEWTGIEHISLDGFWSAEVNKPVVWMGDGETEYDGNGEIFTLTFTVKDDAQPCETAVSLSYDPDDIQTWNEDLIDYENVPFAVLDGTVTIRDTVTATGTVTAWNDSADAEVYLYAADTEETVLNAAAQSGDYSGAILGAATLGDVTASGKRYVCAFTLADVEPGGYKLLVMKPGKYVPVIRMVMLEDDTDLGEVKLWLYGDVTDDGKVNGTDALQIKRYFADISSVFSRGTEEEQAARLIAANVTAVRTGDNKVNGTDALQIQRYFADISSVFEYMR